MTVPKYRERGTMRRHRGPSTSWGLQGNPGFTSQLHTITSLRPPCRDKFLKGGRERGKERMEEKDDPPHVALTSHK